VSFAFQPVFIVVDFLSNQSGNFWLHTCIWGCFRRGRLVQWHVLTFSCLRVLSRPAPLSLDSDCRRYNKVEYPVTKEINDIVGLCYRRQLFLF